MGDADAIRHLEHFRVAQPPPSLEPRGRADDYYLSLVGELFERMRTASPGGADWARVGDALADFASDAYEPILRRFGLARSEALLFAAAAFYCGGFPASAYLTIRSRERPEEGTNGYQACFDLLARPNRMRSEVGGTLIAALREGDLTAISDVRIAAAAASEAAISVGPDEWIAARLFEHLVGRFETTNIRAVLPEGGSEFWRPLVDSFLARTPAVWEFFPSQIVAIGRGLLDRPDTFSMQMPTGAGKTALCEALLYWHAKQPESGVAILLVPYRSLASELRRSLVRRLNAIGIRSRCAYGGTVPVGDELRALDETQVLVATPEALSGALTADAALFRSVSLVICDEGHLLDGGARGVGLELLLARMRSREGGPPRFVFLSAIVPNIEEIHAWLGGREDSVVRSDYRPAIAEFALLRSSRDRDGTSSADLVIHPHEEPPTRFVISGFLSRSDFQWTNQQTGKRNTYPFGSIKTRAVATARKALSMGTSAIFAANKRGDQGAVGLAEELIAQLTFDLSLPQPRDFANPVPVAPVLEYLQLEYGREWVGTRTLIAGAILHHGDIPQETREVLESLLRANAVRLVICTNTLAEGVNLPIRTLVLYSVQRRMKTGLPENLLARDIKNLVGRSGRAGSTTKGLVVCANERQWPMVAHVARQQPGEPVHGFLRKLITRLGRALAAQGLTLTNPMLEATPALCTLVDGIDSTLIDLAVEEVGEEALVALAVGLADETFASVQADAESRTLLESVFELRARRVVASRNAGRLGWIRQTGARLRMMDIVETGLRPSLGSWSDFAGPTDPTLVKAILDWAWDQGEMREALRDALRLDSDEGLPGVKLSFFVVVTAWLSGVPFGEMARQSALPIDDLLSVHAHVISFVLQTLVEQGVALLERLLDAEEAPLASAVRQFPEHLRFGVPTAHARVLAAAGVRHRRATVELGEALNGFEIADDDRGVTLAVAEDLLLNDPELWATRLSDLVVQNTLQDLASARATANPFVE